MTNVYTGHKQSLSAYLTVHDCKAAMEYYAKAFGAVVVMPPMTMADGRIGHVEMKIGDSVFMMADEFPDFGVNGPRKLGDTTFTMHLTVPDVDAVYARAVEHGATGMRAPEDQFWGDRMGQVKDPYGHRWSIASHVEDVAPDEMQRRLSAMGGQNRSSDTAEVGGA